MSESEELIRFGVITDVQYADCDDAFDWAGVHRRYFRDARVKLQQFVEDCRSTLHPAFILQLGDFLDARSPRKEEMLGMLVDDIAASNVPVGICNKPRIDPEDQNYSGPEVYHMWGNHEFYNFSRTELEASRLNTSNGFKAYYDVSPHPSLRIIFYDAYDVSVIGREPNEPEHATSVKLLEDNNPNDEKNSPMGLEGVQRRFVEFNGAIGPIQLSWMRCVLQDAQSKNQCVILAGHVPICNKTDPACMIWNYQEVLDLLHEFPCVAATFSGHDHRGGYTVDEKGIHHNILPAVLETAPGRACHGLVRVFADRIVLDGFGDMPSRTMSIPKNGKFCTIL